MIYQTPEIELMMWGAPDVLTLSNGGSGIDNEISYKDLFAELEELV